MEGLSGHTTLDEDLDGGEEVEEEETEENYELEDVDEDLMEVVHEETLSLQDVGLL